MGLFIDKDYKKDKDGHYRYIGIGGDITPPQPKLFHDYSCLFKDRINIESLDLRSWDMSKVTKTSSMFNGYTGKEVILPYDLLAYEDMDLSYTFENCIIEKVTIEFRKHNYRPRYIPNDFFVKGTNIIYLSLVSVFDTNSKFYSFIDFINTKSLNINVLDQNYKILTENDFDNLVKNNLYEIRFCSSNIYAKAFHNSPLGKFVYNPYDYKFVIKDYGETMYLHYNSGDFMNNKQVPKQPVGLINMNHLFYQLNYSIIDLSNWDFSEVEDMSFMFALSYNLRTVYLSGISKLVDAYRMFYLNKNIKSIYMSNSNFENLHNNIDMFHIYSESSFDIYLSNVIGMNRIKFQLPSNANIIDNSSFGNNLAFNIGNPLGIFEYDSSEYKINALEFSHGDVLYTLRYIGNSSKPNQPKGCRSFNSTFCYSDLAEIDLSHWDMTGVKWIDDMFSHSKCKRLNLSNWNFFSIDNTNLFKDVYHLEELIIKNTKYSKIPSTLSFKCKDLKIIK